MSTLLFEPDLDATYALEVVAELTGVPVQRIRLYQESGLLDPQPAFDDEALRTLCRIEHLHMHYEMSIEALRLVVHLMNEVEAMHQQLRLRR